jgi:hypothetical protein
LTAVLAADEGRDHLLEVLVEVVVVEEVQAMIIYRTVSD